jgi:hypothetical protein
MKHNSLPFFLILILSIILASTLMFVQDAIATTVTWTAKAPMPTARVWISAAVYAGKIYVFSGLSSTTKLATVERYDPETNTWDSRAAMPTARYGSSAVTLNNKIYLIGGVNASNQIVNLVDVYDPLADNWSTAAPMPTARCRLAAVAGPDGKVYAIGGSTTSTLDMSGYTGLVERYDPATDSWSTVAPMNTPRVGLAAAVSGGKIYAFGGYGRPAGYTARYLVTVEHYDPASNTWSSAASMRAARYGLAAASASTGLIYLIGGKNDSSLPPSNNEEYFPSNNSSSYIAALPSGQRSELAAVSINNQGDVLYALGGGNMWTPMNNLEAGTLSDLPQITPTPTQVADPPSAITDLVANPGCASGSILLAWTSPGSNGSVGTASDYLVRYAAQPISSQSDWEAATPLDIGTPDPLPAGTRQSLTVGGLNPGASYYFSIRARNAALTLGDLSNSPSAQAPANSTDKPWTVMMYAAGDNNLDPYIRLDISSIELAAHNTCVNLVLLWDGAAMSDSAYYQLSFDPHMSTWAAYTPGVDKWTLGELNMGDPANLTSFVQWAKTNYPAPHYALVIRDHGDGLGGMEEDDLSHDHLTIPELDQALASITNNGAQPLDLVFMDACLMGMLEDAYQFRGQVGVYVASEDVTWSSMRSNSHHDYFYNLAPTTTAAQLGQMIVNGYADWMEARLAGYNFTMSAVDMAQLDGLVTATNNLAASLAANMTTVSAQVRLSRLATIRYWWSAYIDLYDFADQIYANITDADIRADAQAVKDAIGAYVLAERHSSNKAKSHGVSIFFPVDSSSFYDPAVYDFAVGATWPGGQLSAEPGLAPEDVGWGSLLTQYIQTFPGGPDVSEPPPPVSPQVPSELFLPLLVR